MYRNETIEITPLQNGYLVEYAYREMVNPTATDSYDKYEYRREKYMFGTWDEVVTYVQSTPLAVPPAKM